MFLIKTSYIIIEKTTKLLLTFLCDYCKMVTESLKKRTKNTPCTKPLLKKGSPQEEMIENEDGTTFTIKQYSVGKNKMIATSYFFCPCGKEQNKKYVYEE